jgi:YjbE family integral membrane protein
MHSELTALLTVILIDLVLAGDNAIVVGMAAAGLPPHLRGKAILIGIGTAALLRIVFAIFATRILGVLGLTLAGGLLLLWVAWKLWRELRSGNDETEGVEDGARGLAGAGAQPEKTLGQALFQIILADVSMSLDNVLAVAGIARGHIWVLVIGLTLSVALMGLAATLVARLLKSHPWISYLGFGLIAWVALMMIWDGGGQIFHAATKAGVI